jgi:pilus assembly protein Flp/PilA
MSLKRFWQDESGATAIEYGLIVALISVTLIGVIGQVGGRLQTMYWQLAEALANNSP